MANACLRASYWSPTVTEPVIIKQWVYITYYSSETFGDINDNYNYTSTADGEAWLESEYPPSDYSIGTIAILYHSVDMVWAEFEVQEEV